MTPMEDQPPDVLIIEDDDDIREGVAELLVDEGYRVMTAVDGADALAELQRCGAPRAILLDLMMPNMDGWALQEKLARDPALSSVPLIVFSGINQATEQAAALGAVACITKPFSLDTLLKTVAQYCGR